MEKIDALLNNKGQVNTLTARYVSKKVRLWIREWVEPLIIALCLSVVIRSFLIQPFKIPSGSMHPTLQVGDRLIVNKLRYGPRIPFTQHRLPGFGKARRGDIIVFDYPVDPTRDFVKRLIAFGGETVSIRDGQIWVNDRPVTEKRIAGRHYYNLGPLAENENTITVPKDQVYVLGDNSASSADSRYWGTVPEENIVGRAEWIYWPVTHFGKLR